MNMKMGFAAALIGATALISAKIIYPETFLITEIDTMTDTVICETSEGMQYAFTGAEDYCEGYYISAIMFNGFTPESVFDDEILTTRFAGFIEEELFNDYVAREYGINRN